jgi:hypothetical protein
MPTSVNGFGTRYIGQRDFRTDGSYVTTNFISILFFPLFPLHSVRVIPYPNNMNIPFHTNYYTILEKRRPHFEQVLSIYACAAAVVGMAILFISTIDPFIAECAPFLIGGFFELFAFLFSLSLPLIFATWLQNNAHKRMLAETRDPNNPRPIE